MRNCRQRVKSESDPSPSSLEITDARVESLMEELASAESRVSEKEAEVAALRATSEAQALRIGSFESKLDVSQGESISKVIENDITASHITKSLEEKLGRLLQLRRNMPKPCGRKSSL